MPLKPAILIFAGFFVYLHEKASISKAMNYDTLIEKLYNEYFDSPGDVFIDVSPDLDRKVFLASLFKNKYLPIFIFSVLINNPSLWENLSFDDWRDIVKNTDRHHEKFYGKIMVRMAV